MGGTSTDVDTAEAILALRGAMLMGLPGTPNDAVIARLLLGRAVPVADFGTPDPCHQWPTFHFADMREAAVVDHAGAAYGLTDPGAVLLGTAPPEPVRILCGLVELGVTIQSTRATGTPIGAIDSDRQLLHLFHDEWEALAGIGEWVTVDVSGNEYRRGKELEERALFDIVFHRIEIVARDEA